MAHRGGGWGSFQPSASRNFENFERLLRLFRVSSTTSKTQLKKSYMSLVKKAHPDLSRAQNAQREFLKLQDDWAALEQYLNDPAFLQAWERWHNGVTSSPGPQAPQWARTASEGAAPPYGASSSRENPFEHLRQAAPKNEKHPPWTVDWKSEGYRRWQHSWAARLHLFLVLSGLVAPAILVMLGNGSRRRDENEDTQTVAAMAAASATRDVKMLLLRQLIHSNGSDAPLDACPIGDQKSNVAVRGPLDNTPLRTGFGNSLESSIVLVTPVQGYGPHLAYPNQLQTTPSSSQMDLVPRAERFERGNIGLGTQKKGKSAFPDPAHDPYFHTRPERHNTLHRAVIDRRFDDCVWLLLDGRFAGFPDRRGRTPLHYAAYSGQLDLCRLLLLFNANPLSSDSYNETPLDAARRRRQKDVETLLVFAVTGDRALAQTLPSSRKLPPYNFVFHGTVPKSLGPWVPEGTVAALKAMRSLPPN